MAFDHLKEIATDLDLAICGKYTFVKYTFVKLILNGSN